MTVDATYIGYVASEFATVDSGKISFLAGLAYAQCPLSFWQTTAQQDNGVAYLVCHMLKLDQLRGSGAVTAKGIKDLSLSYQAPAGGVTSPDSLEMTSYGKEFKRLRNMLSRGALVT
jgi:hypothetical protein